MTYREQIAERHDNLGWCKPLSFLDGKVIVAMANGNVVSIQIDGKDISCEPDNINAVAKMVKRHGSCGLGINETVVRHELNPLYFGMLAENPVLINHLVSYLMLMRKGYVPVRLHQLGVYEISELDRRYLESDTIIENWLFQLSKMLDYCVIANDDIINQYDSVVFEGAQGLLLDNDFVQFAPNLTSSKTGSVNPKNILSSLNLLDYPRFLTKAT